MQRKPGFTAVSLLISLLLFPGFAPFLLAQDAPPPPSPQQLDQLLAPIALYPDSLLAQITTASTNPQEILDVNNWLASNPNLTGTALTDAAQQQGFDPAFIALVSFPTVLQMMAENIDDYASIGQAFTTNQAEVTASIQRLRAQAYASGALRSNQQLQVEVQQGPQPIYVIQPANPQVVYIPQYDPTVVYAPPSTGAIVATSLISFGVGIGIGALIANSHPWGWGGWGWNWGHGIYYNHAVWGGWHGGYRPPNMWYRPHPIVWNTRPGYGGNWHYRPPHYYPPRPRPPVAIQPGPGNRPIYRPPTYRPPTNRPPTNRPPGTRPPNQRPPNNGNPGTRPPSTRPPNNQRPPSTRPPNNGNRPGTPGGAPGTPRPQPSPSRPPQNQRPPNNGNQPRPQPSRPPQNQRPPQNGGQRPPNQRPPQSSRPSPGNGNPQAQPQPR